MPTRLRDFQRPTDWNSALDLLGSNDAAAFPLLTGPKPSELPAGEGEVAVDLSRLGLAYINSESGEVRIGALTPLQALADSTTLASDAQGLLLQAARLVAHPGLRRIATLGGSLLSPGGPPEVLLALLCLEARVVTRSKAHPHRETPLTEFLSRAHGLAAGELLVEVRYAPPAGKTSGSALERIGRTPRDEAILAAAAVLTADGGVMRSVRVALAGASPLPRRLPKVESLLEGQAPSETLLQTAAQTATEASNPVPDYRAGDEYRRAMAGVLARRVVAAAWKKVER